MYKHKSGNEKQLRLKSSKKGRQTLFQLVHQGQSTSSTGTDGTDKNTTPDSLVTSSSNNVTEKMLRLLPIKHHLFY